MCNAASVCDRSDEDDSGMCKRVTPECYLSIDEAIVLVRYPTPIVDGSRLDDDRPQLFRSLRNRKIAKSYRTPRVPGLELFLLSYVSQDAAMVLIFLKLFIAQRHDNPIQSS